MRVAPTLTEREGGGNDGDDNAELDEQREEYDHFEGLLHDELEEMDLVEELQLEEKDGRFEQLDIELLELLLD